MEATERSAQSQTLYISVNIHTIRVVILSQSNFTKDFTPTTSYIMYVCVCMCVYMHACM